MRKKTSKKYELTNNERNDVLQAGTCCKPDVLQALLERSKDRLLECGAIKQVADEFGIERHAVGRHW